MMKIYFLLFSIFLFSLGVSAQRLHGKVVDSTNGQPIPGAVIYFPQLKLGTTTDVNGRFTMTSIPYGTYEMEVQILDYTTLTKQITINDSTTCNCKMCTMANCNMNEVVITALGNITNTLRSPTPVGIVTHDMLMQNTSSTIIDAISTQPGVNMTTEGVGTTKPQINGLGFDRVLVLTDGLRQEDFQWGDDHGILIDPYSVYDAEIIRGPASLQYGASAEAGVISFKTRPFAEDGTTQGSVLTEYQTNNGYIGTSEDVGENHNGFAWDLRASNEDAHDYWDPKDGYVWGTAWQQDNGRLTLGLTKSWGYSRISVSLLERRIEVPDGNRDSTGRFIYDAPQNGQLYPTNSNFMAYNPTIAGDKILDEIQTWWQNSINVGKGKLELDIGFTQSIHHDIDTGTVGSGNFHVQDIPYSLKYQIISENSGLKLTTGVNGTYEFESNYAEPPAPYIGDYEIPNYTDLQAGGYAILEEDYKNLTVSGGLRYDYNNFIGQSMYLLNANTPEQEVVSANTSGATLQFPSFNNVYTGPSGSIGASYQLPDNNYLKLNISKSFRAPSIDELTSNGVNIGVNAFQQGNLNLKAEQGYQVDFAYGNNGKDVSFEVDGFCNLINNFIFPVRVQSKLGGDSLLDGVPYYNYIANQAIITGFSGYFNIHPDDTPWLEIDNNFTYVYSYFPNQTDSTQHVPWTPAPRLTTEIKFKLQKANSHWLIANSYVKFGMAKYWAQNDIYSALYSEIPSLAHTLFNAGVGTNFVNPSTGRVICSLYINCTNLFNIGYADHLNLAQYFLAYNGTPVTVTQQSQGIYNMGRNVGFKLLFPIGGHKTSEGENKIGE
jgi:iron complex outermembrane recepter protein